MADLTADAIAIARETERLRQESETFEQRKKHEQEWFMLRLRMGYTAVVLLPLIAIVAIFILSAHTLFSEWTITAATSCLFGDVLGLSIAIYKIVLSQNTSAALAPVTINANANSAKTHIGKRGSTTGP